MASAVLGEAPAMVDVRPADATLYEVLNGRYVELPPMSVYATWIASRQVYVSESPTRVRILAADETLDGGDLLTGLTVSVRSLFERAVWPTAATATD